MTHSGKLLRTLCYEAICTLQPCTKGQIKEFVADAVYDRGLDSREFMKAFGDCGWVFQNLKPAVVCTEIAPKKYVWTAA
jgi:hypothetical protein